jgi:hypothetical protein
MKKPTKKCFPGFHKFVNTKSKNIVLPKEGPYDPRTDLERTEHLDMRTCVRCGLEQTRPHWSML